MNPRPHRLRIDRLALSGLPLSEAQLSCLPQMVSEAVRRRLEGGPGAAEKAGDPAGDPAEGGFVWDAGMDERGLAQGIGGEVARQTAARLARRPRGATES
jgi:hypothetical protein